MLLPRLRHLCLWVLLFAVGLVPPLTFAYDGHDQATVVYDVLTQFPWGYDTSSIPTTDAEQNGPRADTDFLAKNGGFLAVKTTPTVDRLRNVAQQGYDYAVQNPRVRGLNRMQLGKDAEVQATRWTRRWAERNDVNLGPGGLQFQVRGANPVPDVIFDPARQIFDFKLTPRAVRATTSNTASAHEP